MSDFHEPHPNLSPEINLRGHGGMRFSTSEIQDVREAL